MCIHTCAYITYVCMYMYVYTYTHKYVIVIIIIIAVIVVSIMSTSIRSIRYSCHVIDR